MHGVFNQVQVIFPWLTSEKEFPAAHTAVFVTGLVESRNAVLG